jgi:predicted DCC family thiol-disulfide oxidoreductase YuxK
MKNERESAPDSAEDLVTYYNGSCPVCRFEIDHYRDKEIAGLGWRDISRDDAALAELGISRDDAKRRLHVMLPDGTVRSGVDAFAEIWRRMPGFNWLSRLVSAPVIRPVAGWIYDRILAPVLFAWNRRAGR